MGESPFRFEGKGTLMEKPTKNKVFIPEKYGMIFCPSCNGRGKFFKDLKGFNVCIVCGGFGAIKVRSEKPIEGKGYGEQKTL